MNKSDYHDTAETVDSMGNFRQNDPVASKQLDEQLRPAFQKDDKLNESARKAKEVFESEETFEYTTKEGRELIAHKPIGFQKPAKPKVTKYYQVKGHTGVIQVIVANTPIEAQLEAMMANKELAVTDIKLIEIIQEDN